MTVREAKEKFDYFWVFMPKYDAWRLARYLRDKMVVVFDGSLWVIHADFNEDWEAVGIEMPKHPRSVTVSKQ